MAFSLRRTPMPEPLAVHESAAVPEPMADESARAALELTADLLTVGVRPGQDLIVHCSMRQVGPIPGGAATLLRALRSAIGPEATLVVPAQTTYRLPEPPAPREYRCFVLRHGVREEYTFIDICLYDGDFEELGEQMAHEPFVRHGRVGSAVGCRLLPVRGAVDFALAWPPFSHHRAVR